MSDLSVRSTSEDDCWTIDAHPLRLVVRLAGDRWIHELSVATQVGLVCFARSVEGNVDRDSPSRVVSPAYQEVQEHPGDSFVRLLLTGQSTPHHFSAVLTVQRNGGEVRAEFDVADRCRAQVEALAATYQLDAVSSDLVAGSPDRLIWQCPDWGIGTLELEPLEGATTCLAETGRIGSIAQCLAQLNPADYTHRLRYAWTWKS
ncbi:hypothetical protein EP7_003909 [Isosphaeraceae bacterium EP7]